ncbi:MAG: HIT domain-containing protein [Nanoarchaeota archaeon]|nr:HIT domain-containing protein [Nanoarchaeota archaeon]
MAKCIICDIISGSVPTKKIYEDDEILAILDFNGANPGHSFVIPKEHIPILEQVPSNLMGKLFNIANKISSAIFETLGVQGTNIFVTNGVSAGQKVAHFMVNIIPRKENDGINLQWQPRQLNEEEMSTVELKLKDEISKIGVSEAPKEVKHQKKEPAKKIDGKENYLVKQLRRIP